VGRVGGREASRHTLAPCGCRDQINTVAGYFMIITNRRSTDLKHCPYLGLHDDRSTALAYPSPWNYCYRATRPAPVLVSHQAEVCLCSRYADCPVMLSSKPGRFPRSLRGRTGANLRNTGSVRWLPWLIAFVLLTVLLTLLFFPPHFLF
jgi:hypothetical protein